MPKSLTKIWMGGLKRLMAIQTEHARATTKRALPRPAAAKVAKPLKPAVPSKASARSATRESRVGPRAAAWANGAWTRSFHSAPAAPGRLVNHLDYGLYVPGAFASKGMPLVVMLHGCKQTADEFAQGTRMNLLADRYGFAVVYPEQSKHAHAHRCWHWYDTGDQAGAAEARAIVSLVDALIDQHGFDGERVYVAGLSAGAGMAMQLAIRYPQRFAALALHSGPAFGEANSGIAAMDVMRRGLRRAPQQLIDEMLEPSRYPGMPAIVLHGDHDPVVAPANAPQLVAQCLRLNGMIDAEGARRAGEVRDERSGGTLTRDYLRGGKRVVRLVQVGRLDHAWSGGDDAVPFHASAGPDASALIWELFRYQRRPGAFGLAGDADTRIDTEASAAGR